MQSASNEPARKIKVPKISYRKRKMASVWNKSVLTCQFWVWYRPSTALNACPDRYAALFHHLEIICTHSQKSIGHRSDLGRRLYYLCYWRVDMTMYLMIDTHPFFFSIYLSFQFNLYAPANTHLLNFIEFAFICRKPLCGNQSV